MIKLTLLTLSVMLTASPLLAADTACSETLRMVSGPVPAALDSDLTGSYFSGVERGTMLNIDEYDRVQTNIQVQTQTGARSPITLPFRLKRDEMGTTYSTLGYIAFDFQSSIGVIRCQYDVRFGADFSADGRVLDATFFFPQQVGVDTGGNCFSAGEIKSYYGFTRDL